MLVLSTIHQAKGLEWSRVFVPRLIEESFPNYRALGEPGGEDEERRIFYVAVTRAMDELYLTYPHHDRARRLGSEHPDQAEPVPQGARPEPLRNTAAPAPIPGAAAGPEASTPGSLHGTTPAR